MRCQGCGRQAAVGAVQCTACGDSLGAVVAVAEPRVAALPTEWLGHVPAISGVHLPASTPAGANALAPLASRTIASTPVPALHARPSSQVHGRVILMEGPVVEPAGFDGVLLFCQVLWLGLLLVMPLLVLHAAISSLIVAPSFLLLLAIAWLLGMLSPRHLLQAISMIFRMGQWGRTGGETIPVRYLRIRDLEDDRESVVRLVGHLSAANVLLDDIVAFSGWRRRGVLYATHGRNLRTGSRIRIRKSRSRLLLAVTLFIYAMVIAAFVAMAYGPQLTGAL